MKPENTGNSSFSCPNIFGSRNKQTETPETRAVDAAGTDNIELEVGSNTSEKDTSSSSYSRLMNGLRNRCLGRSNSTETPATTITVVRANKPTACERWKTGTLFDCGNEGSKRFPIFRFLEEVLDKIDHLKSKTTTERARNELDDLKRELGFADSIKKIISLKTQLEFNQEIIKDIFSDPLKNFLRNAASTYDSIPSDLDENVIENITDYLLQIPADLEHGNKQVLKVSDFFTKEIIKAQPTIWGGKYKDISLGDLVENHHHTHHDFLTDKLKPIKELLVFAGEAAGTYSYIRVGHDFKNIDQNSSLVACAVAVILSKTIFKNTPMIFDNNTNLSDLKKDIMDGIEDIRGLKSDTLQNPIFVHLMYFLAIGLATMSQGNNGKDSFATSGVATAATLVAITLSSILVNFYDKYQGSDRSDVEHFIKEINGGKSIEEALREEKTPDSRTVLQRLYNAACCNSKSTEEDESENPEAPSDVKNSSTKSAPDDSSTLTCFNWGAENNDEEKEADSDSSAVTTPSQEIVSPDDTAAEPKQSRTTISQMAKGCFKRKDKKATSSDEQPVDQNTPMGTENTDAANQRTQSRTKLDIGDMVLKIAAKKKDQG